MKITDDQYQKLKAKIKEKMTGRPDGAYYLNQLGDYLYMYKRGTRVTYAVGCNMFEFEFSQSLNQ